VGRDIRTGSSRGEARSVGWRQEPEECILWLSLVCFPTVLPLAIQSGPESRRLLDDTLRFQPLGQGEGGEHI
jgi:hypothetical protein